MTKNKTLKIFFGLVFIVLLFVVLLFFLKKTIKPEKIELIEIKNQSKVQKPHKGALELTAENNQTIYAVEDTINMTLRGTVNESIIGYDAVIRFDPKKVALVAMHIIDKRYQVVKTESTDEAIITGFLDSKESVSKMEGNQLISLSFRALKKGTSNIVLFTEKSKSRRDSNLINGSGDDILDYVYFDTILIGNKETLKLKSPKIFSGVTFMIESVSIPQKDCIDCVIKTSLIVEKNKSKKRAVIKQRVNTDTFKAPISVFNGSFQLITTSPDNTLLYFFMSSK